MKKRAIASNLALRFYERDGWTIEELNQYLVKGKWLLPRPEDGDLGYFILDVYSVYDEDKIAGAVSEIINNFDSDYLTNRQVIADRNW